MGIPGYLLDPFGIFHRCLRLGAAYESCLLHRLPTPSAVEFGPGRQGAKRGVPQQGDLEGNEGDPLKKKEILDKLI